MSLSSDDRAILGIGRWLIVRFNRSVNRSNDHSERSLRTITLKSYKGVPEITFSPSLRLFHSVKRTLDGFRVRRPRGAGFLFNGGLRSGVFW